MNKEFPARLHALFASEAKYGVVIRRGPSKHTCFIEWDRRNDTFKPSQWLKGRVYERRSDLSPNGKYMIYFAMNGKWESDTKGDWTTISKNPWMKAIALFGKGDCWNGGGLFLNNDNYWLNDGCGHEIVKQTNKVIRDLNYRPNENYGGECPGVYFIRLQRDGWTLKEHQKKGKWEDTVVFEKPLPKGWILRKVAHAQVGSPKGKGVYWDEHELISADGVVEKFSDWEWAELDEKRIVYASKGCLFSSSMKSGSKFGSSNLLYDFNDMVFKRVAAPY